MVNFKSKQNIIAYVIVISGIITGVYGITHTLGVGVFRGVFLTIAGVLWFFNVNFDLLKDGSAAAKKPYSYSRVQLAWWNIIIISSFTSIFIISHELPTFNNSDLILLGIGIGTTAVAAAIEITDKSKNNLLIQDHESEGLLLDILSDKNGITLSRVQAVFFNLIVGVWYIHKVNFGSHGAPVIPDGLAYLYQNLKSCTENMTKTQNHSFEALKSAKDVFVNHVLPVVEPNNLILMGISAGAYAVFKTSENVGAPANKQEGS